MKKIKKITCSFKNTCKRTYGGKFRNVCPKYNNSIKFCALMEDIKLGVVDKHIINLVKKEIKTKTEKYSKNKLNKQIVYCPRSEGSKLELKKNCPIHDCIYYSNKLSYNCMIIHSSIFFPTKTEIANNVFEVATNLTKEQVKIITNIGLFLTRIILIIAKYENTVYIKGKSSLFNKVENNFKVCPICKGIYDIDSNKLGTCLCIDDIEIRKTRKKVYSYWRKKLDKYRLEYSVYNSCEEMAKSLGTKLNSLNYFRYCLARLTINENKIWDIPLGYLIKSYENTFADKTNAAHTLGMTDKLYKIAKRVFLC